MLICLVHVKHHYSKKTQTKMLYKIHWGKVDHIKYF